MICGLWCKTRLRAGLQNMRNMFCNHFKNRYRASSSAKEPMKERDLFEIYIEPAGRLSVEFFQCKPVTRIIATRVWSAKKIAISMITFGLPHSFVVSRSPYPSPHITVGTCHSTCACVLCLVGRLPNIVSYHHHHHPNDNIVLDNWRRYALERVRWDVSPSFGRDLFVFIFNSISYYPHYRIIMVTFSVFFTVLDRCFFTCMFAEMRPDAALPCFVLPA